jgi:hypothetical protein
VIEIGLVLGKARGRCKRKNRKAHKVKEAILQDITLTQVWNVTTAEGQATTSGLDPYKARQAQLNTTNFGSLTISD